MSIKAQLIIIGGFAGSGKSTLAKRVGKTLSIPVFEIDQIARSINDSRDFHGTGQESYGITFDLFFAFAENHLKNQSSLILDQNMGHELTWKNVEKLRNSLNDIETVIFLLDCPYELCLKRVHSRSEHPNLNQITADDLHQHKFKWDYLNENAFPEAVRIDATRPQNVVFDKVMLHLNASH